MGGAVESRGRAQISASFRLPDSHVYNAETAADAQLQATASVQSTVEWAQIAEVGAGLGQDPQDSRTRLSTWP